MDREGSKEGEERLKEFLQLLKSILIKRHKDYEKSRIQSLKCIEMYETIFKDKDSSKAERLLALHGQRLESRNLEMQSGELINLTSLYTLATYVNDVFSQQLEESGVIEKLKDVNVEEIKQLQEEFTSFKEKLEKEWQPHIDNLRKAIEKKKKWLQDNR